MGSERIPPNQGSHQKTPGWIPVQILGAQQTLPTQFSLPPTFKATKIL